MDKRYQAETTAMAMITREGALLAGGTRAILLQVAYPSVGRGVNEHSDFTYRVMDRLHATLTYDLLHRFRQPSGKAGDKPTSHRVHQKINGPGSTALNPELQLWVAATLYDTTTRLYDRWLGPLDDATAAAAYRQYRILGTVLQIPEDLRPANQSAFDVYWPHMLDVLEVTDVARDICQDLFYPKRFPLWLRVGMPLNRLVTAGLLPPRIREAYGLEWNALRQRRLDLFSATVRTVYPHLPVNIRQLHKTYCLRGMRPRMAHRS